MLTGAEIKKQVEKGSITISPFQENLLGPNSYDIRLGRWFWIYSLKRRTYLLFDLRNDSVNGLFIKPGQQILAHTKEAVGSNEYIPLLYTRSSWARRGLDICGSAGFGDLGFISPWTLELRSTAPDLLKLEEGDVIGQFSFIKPEGSIEYLYKGQYHIEDPTDWTPEKMLAPSLDIRKYHAYEFRS